MGVVSAGLPEERVVLADQLDVDACHRARRHLKQGQQAMGAVVPQLPPTARLPVRALADLWKRRSQLQDNRYSGATFHRSSESAVLDGVWRHGRAVKLMPMYGVHDSVQVRVRIS